MTLRAASPREALEEEIRSLESRRDRGRGRARFDAHLDMQIMRARERMRRMDHEQEEERLREHRRRLEEERVRWGGREEQRSVRFTGSMFDYTAFDRWREDVPENTPIVIDTVTPEPPFVGLQQEINRIHSQIATGFGGRSGRKKKTTTWARGPLRKDDMEENGHKVHLTTRDGYRKTIRIPGVVGERVSIPELVVGAAATGGLTNPAMTRRDFRVTRKAVYTDLINGGEAQEYWATET